MGLEHMHNSERISALLDGAGDADDLAALANLGADPTARNTWARYQLIGEVLRDDGFEQLTLTDLSRRIADGISREPTPAPWPDNVQPLPRPAPPRGGLQRWVGLAAAASVAAFAYFGLSQPGSGPSPAAPVASDARGPAAPLALVAAPALPADGAVEAEQVSTLSAEEYQRRINSYLVNFNEQRTQMGVPGVHPYVRVVGFESAREP